MNHLFRLLILLGGVMLGNTLLATPIGPMNYQGRLLDNNGIPVTGTYNFKVRIYDAETNGTKTYEESHSNVTVDDGVYSFLVGQGAVEYGSWDINLWNDNNLYLETEVAVAPATSGETLSPRHRLAAAPFAFQANLALTTNNALALGGKTAAEYDNILADICVSGKGKWLELVEQCLGIGASFPGPTLVNWNTLTASSDFTGMDLSNADVSGIDFDGADLTGTAFKKTTYAVEGMGGATLRDTEWNSATSTDASVALLDSDTNLMNATFQNMDMADWDLSSLSIGNINNLSAAEISACTAGLPAGWECRSDDLGGSNYFLLGPGVNLSAGSAASSFKFGSSYLNLGKNALANSNLNGSSFVGNVINQNFNNVDLTDVNFSYATITNSVFSGTGTRIINSKFVNARVDRPAIQPGVVFDAADFTEADLNYVKFQQDILTGANFSGATLRGVGFAGLNNANFTGAVLDGVYIDSNHGNNNFTNVRFYNGFRHGQTVTPTMTYLGGSTFYNVVFIGGTLSGDFNNAVFTGVTIFDTVTFSHLDLCHANIPLQDMTAQHDDLKTISWAGQIECPNGQNIATTGTCNTSNYWTGYTLGTCDPGVP